MVVAMVGPNAQFVTFPSTEAAHEAGQPSASSLMALLNELGGQGWQLVSAAPADDMRSGRYWLKRQVVQEVDYQPGGGWVDSV